MTRSVQQTERFLREAMTAFIQAKISFMCSFGREEFEQLLRDHDMLDVRTDPDGNEIILLKELEERSDD